MRIVLSSAVVYEPDSNRVVFLRNGEQRNPAERAMEYLEELYPDKPWLEIALLAIPELEVVGNLSSVRFYSM